LGRLKRALLAGGSANRSAVSATLGRYSQYCNFLILFEVFMIKNIEPNEAWEKYKISTNHQEMDSGELRFRLKKDDGTAYIRTEAASTGEWQTSHYHKNCKETYIVQRGWIACAEMNYEHVKLKIYKNDEIFTIMPGIIHNIYLPSNAVIHTIKHGISKDGDRITDNETKKLDSLTISLSENQIRYLSRKGSSKISEVYSAEYRHFDTLIWQLPAWSTAVFIGSIMGGISIANIYINESTGLSSKGLLWGFFLLMACILQALSHVLYRFRKTQRPLKRYVKTPFWKSAQTYLLLITNLESLILFFLFLVVFFEMSSCVSALICFVFLLLITFLREYYVRKVNNIIKNYE
jgi:hypothetical protein